MVKTRKSGQYPMYCRRGKVVLSQVTSITASYWSIYLPIVFILKLMKPSERPSIADIYADRSFVEMRGGRFE